MFFGADISGANMPDVDALIGSIGSCNLRAVAAHWRHVRRAQIMPSWQDLNPSAVAKQLPLMWAFKYDQQTGEFSGRLVGDEIRQLLHKNVRGATLKDIFSTEEYAWIHAILNRAVKEPAIHWYSGKVLSYLGRHGFGERLVLPLSNDGVSADGILGITEYHYRRPDVNADSIDAEMETWLSLRPARQIA